MTTCICSNNRIETLDLSNSPLLTLLEVYGNRITVLDVTGCKPFYNFLKNTYDNLVKPEDTKEGYYAFVMNGELGLLIDPWTGVRLETYSVFDGRPQ